MPGAPHQPFTGPVGNVWCEACGLDLTMDRRSRRSRDLVWRDDEGSAWCDGGADLDDEVSA